jgi:drug/metabolite transporter (DMT)-like permease
MERDWNALFSDFAVWPCQCASCATWRLCGSTTAEHYAMQSLWMIAASFLFACMGVCVKFAAVFFSTAEIVFYRSLIALLLMFLLVRARGIPIATPHWRFQLWRSVSGFVSLMLYFYALSMLPLATAVTLAYTSPLFLTLYLGWFKKTRLRPGMLGALALGFVGVVLLLRPTFHAEQLLGGLIGLGSGMVAGLAYYNVKELGERGEVEERTVFYFSLVSALISALWMMLFEFHRINAQGALLLLGVGGFGTLAQLAMTRAYKRGRTLMAASLAYSTVIFASVFGMLFWQETLSVSAWSAIALIVASGVVATLFSRANPAEQD